jgi:L-alanine-DL-glutamate epimerase-like enolase superfamily enzyme
MTLPEYREGLLKKLLRAQEFGFPAAKLEVCVKGCYSHNRLSEPDEAIIDVVRACREAVGPGMQLMVDVAHCWSDWKETLRVIRRLEPFDIFFVGRLKWSENPQGIPSDWESSPWPTHWKLAPVNRLYFWTNFTRLS